MSQHPNARLTPKGRETLVSRARSGVGVAEAVRQISTSRQTESKRPARSRRDEGLSSRSSRPRRLARLTPPDVEGRVVAARSSMFLAPLALAAVTGVPARTCAQIAVRSGLPRLSDIDRVTGEARRRGPSTPVRYECTGTCAAFMGLCLRFFEGMGVGVESVMTDNGPSYRSGEFDGVLASEGVRHLRTRPCSPRQNGKVERMNRTLAQERRYERAWKRGAGSAEALPACIERYNRERSHSACGAFRPCLSSSA